MTMNLLAIGSHPDDIELGCGGLLIKTAKNGHNVYLLALTRGSASGDPRQRTREFIQSAKFIGARDFLIGDFEDAKLTEGVELINYIESYIEKVDPDVILTHSYGDVHHDHRAVASATVEAGRYHSNILSYEIPLTRNFAPTVYYDISDVIDKKIELIRIFWSQQTKMFLRASAIKGLAEYRALQSRLPAKMNYVEAFEVMRLCLDKEFRLQESQHDKPFMKALNEPVTD